MKRYTYAGGLAALASTLFGLAAATPSIAVAYCASINTASTDANSSTYQSEGLCYDYCNDEGYALGVLQDKDCWCSNYVPASSDQVATSKWYACSVHPPCWETQLTTSSDSSCPGYPDDYCGGDDLYGYIQLSAAVSGTSGGDSSTATSTSTSSSVSTSCVDVVSAFLCFSPHPRFHNNTVFISGVVLFWSLNDSRIQIIVTSTEVQTSIRIETETETVQDSVTTTFSSDLTTSTSLTSEKTSETTSSSTKTTVCQIL